MLTPDTRSVLLDDLQAPPGYEVDHAVATTFTLDLTAAMLPPFALSGIGSGALGRDPIALLQALRRASDKVDLFCQAGSIGIPKSADLVAFLEPMIHQVVPPVGGLFHPKIWLLRFVAPDFEPRYRLLVLSRNLTHDNTWDIAVRLDSESRGDAAREQNQPLVDLLRWLPGNSLHLDPVRRRRVERLADEVSRVLWERPEHVESIAFHAGGVPGQPGTTFRSRAHLVISPFVTADGLEQVTAGPRRRAAPILISRQESLDALEAEALEGITAYTMAADTELPMTGQDADPDSEPVASFSGLHAKVYVLEPTDKWATARVLLGSSNATGPALTRNVEFLVEVVGHKARLGIAQILPPDHESKEGIRPLVEPYVRQELPDQSEDTARRALQRHLRLIAAIPHLVDITEEAGAPAVPTYSATVSAASRYPIRDGLHITINFLTRAGVTASVEDSPHLTVTRLKSTDITPCITVTATDGTYSESTIVLGHLVGSPEGRLDAVIANQIDDEDKFRRLVLLLLSLGDPAELAALLAERGGGDGTVGFFGSADSGILELVLRALASSSDTIADLDRVVDAVDDDVMPDGFEAFWDQVRQAREMIGQESA